MALVSKRSSYSEQDEHAEFWFNLETKQVEVGKQSAATQRIGPFSSRQEAELALETAAKRAAKWRDEEETEN